ncbi:hypothetical protein [Pararobbsia silviterrae]|uniref:Uncharacterized protein n=1 Tax=Pararobbsia silviterrae TaxID=1792498 RepID=A0A494X1U6_9BURK|nr:hypothetical protein [Pararobbsia silviterrae]RKP44687.1 hypothetical protein D7S86_27030 [Pararobbsia silviterrae]
MKLTKTLLRFLHKKFKKDPLPFNAFTITCDGSDLAWVVADDVLTLTPTGGQASALTVDLSAYTLLQLVQYLASEPGYNLSALSSDYRDLSSLVLLDGSGAVSAGTNTLTGYTNVLYALMEANARELQTAHDAIDTLPDQMATTTAAGDFLDLLGSYYNVPRATGELDAVYGPRIIATVLRPASNNVALEMAIETYTGQSATVTDVVTSGVTGSVYNSDHDFDGSIDYNAVSTNVYGLFDVSYAYDLINGGDLTSFQTTVVSLINTLRAAGTHMRSIALTGSVLSDTLTPPTDSFHTLGVGVPFADTLTSPTESMSVMPTRLAQLSDTLTTPTDAASMTVSYNYDYSGLRSYNGVIEHLGGFAITEDLA